MLMLISYAIALPAALIIYFAILRAPYAPAPCLRIIRHAALMPRHYVWYFLLCYIDTLNCRHISCCCRWLAIAIAPCRAIDAFHFHYLRHWWCHYIYYYYFAIYFDDYLLFRFRYAFDFRHAARQLRFDAFCRLRCHAIPLYFDYFRHTWFDDLLMLSFTPTLIDFRHASSLSSMPPLSYTLWCRYGAADALLLPAFTRCMLYAPRIAITTIIAAAAGCHYDAYAARCQRHIIIYAMHAYMLIIMPLHILLPCYYISFDWFCADSASLRRFHWYAIAITADFAAAAFADAAVI